MAAYRCSTKQSDIVVRTAQESAGCLIIISTFEAPGVGDKKLDCQDEEGKQHNHPGPGSLRSRSSINCCRPISSVIRASPESFRVAWIERRYDNGQLAATERWTAILTIVIETPRDADRLRKNPLGVYVNAVNWSKEVGQ